MTPTGRGLSWSPIPYLERLLVPMPKIDIVPADDPRVLCEFTVPRKGAKAIEFSVRRMEYLTADESDAFDDWFDKRTSPTEAVDADGNVVMENEAPKLISPAFLGTPELCLKALECAGVPKAKLNQIEKLTPGEKIQIWTKWAEVSQMTLGESVASGDS